MPKTTTALLFVMLFVLVDVGAVHSQFAQCSVSSAQDISADIYNSMAFSSIGIAISFAFVGIAFMVGEIFAIEGFKNWYKQDLWETTKSIILVVAIFSLLAISSALALALAGVQAPASGGSSVSSTISSNLNALYAADLINYICIQKAEVNDAFAGVLGLHLGIAALSSLTISAYIPIPIPYVGSFDIGFFSVSPFSSHMIAASKGSSSFTDVIADDIVVPTMIIFQVLGNYFYIIMYAGLLVFIPIGVFLRAIPFLRGLGGTMIAGGITLSLIFPTLLMVFNLPVTNFLAPLTVSSYLAAPTSCPSVGSGNPTYVILNGLVCALYTGFFDIIGAAGSWISGSQGFFAGLGTFFASSPSIYPAMNFITNYALMALIQFILLIFDVIIAAAIGDSIAKMLGGTLSLGIGKLKLI